jgi:hypothetical protein
MRRPVVLLLAVLLVAACQALPIPQAPGALLVSVTGRGGECPEGTCEWRMDLFRDGRVTSSDGTTRQVDPDAVARAATQIAAADWNAILARPFTGECPTAFDGQELVYTFPTVPEPLVVASCSTQIDPGQEPFGAIDSALFTSGG